MDLWGATLTVSSVIFLIFALALALSFEFVNGFHDTANAVATVIYTNTLKPTYAVVWSGLVNLAGALFSTGAVAYSILALLPVELVLNSGTGAGFAMVLALLLSAIIWNLGTWYLGLPASSSHTLIGAIMGVGIGNAIMNGHPWMEGLNMDKVYAIGLALLVSPLVGFIGSALLLLLLKAVVPRKDLFEAPTGSQPPPLWIRSLLVLTCTGVSWSHGSNDAQKGMGLIMLILIGIVPGAFALNINANADGFAKLNATLPPAVVYFQSQAGSSVATKEQAETELSEFIKKSGKVSEMTFASLVTLGQAIPTDIGSATKPADLTAPQRTDLRKEMALVSESSNKLIKSKKITDPAAIKTVGAVPKSVEALTKYIPIYVKVMVACALGFGTMIGWKRIVVTVGEKIGKAHLTYAQGASAEFTAMCTVFGADVYALPVSTTHVLSSGVAGTMFANRSGLQTQTLINILLAWVLTLPVCVFLGATLFSFGLFIVFHFFS